MAAKKFLMIAGDFVEDYEVMVPFQTLTMLGHFVDVVCPNKKADEKIATAIHDFEGHQTYTEKPGHNFTLNANFSDIRPEEYDALLLPGGRAPEYLRLNPRVIEIVRYFAEAHKPIGAICHGVQILLTAGLAKGKNLTSYCAVGPDIISAGGRYVEVPIDGSYADGNLITAPAWTAHPSWLKKVLKAVGADTGPVTRIEYVSSEE